MPPPSPADSGDARADAWDRALGLQTHSPGQNAFAQKKIEDHRFRLETNAFYQRKFSHEKPAAAPTAVHPAFRQASSGSAAMPPARDSNVTTMSVFVRAGEEVDSPPLNLHTTPKHTPQPTQRGWIEEQKEQQQHARSGSKDDRTPVFRPTPLLQSDEFGMVKQSTNKKGHEVKFGDQQPLSLPTKSPKKSLFGRFFGAGKNQSPMPDVIPPKAEQILGEKTPRRGGLGRSPSKQKGFFARRSSDADALVSPHREREVAEPPRSQSSMGMHHNSMSSRGSLTKRVGSQQSGTISGTTPLITRTQSLKYMNSGIPPTPPSKDTPPDEKALRTTTNLQAPIIPFDNNTPTKSTGFVSTDRNLSPTKVGSYGYRVGANLVTKPSMHSMRASVVPNEMDPADFEEAKYRMEGLGIEGFSMPSETRRHNPPSYSPSVYSPEWGRRSVATFPERIEERKEEEESPSMKMVGKGHFFKNSFDTTDTDCTSATIHVALDQRVPTYPELVKDSSIVDFMRYTSDETPKIGEATPLRAVDEKLQSMAHLFAANNGQGYADSPMSHHSSAQVSPLHLHSATLEILPATTYKPPATPFNKQKTKQSELSSTRVRHRKSQSLSAVESTGSPASRRSSPSRDLLESRPLLPKEISPAWKEQRSIFNIDPQKRSSNVDLSKSLGQRSLSRSDEQIRHDKIDLSKSLGQRSLSRSDEQIRPNKVQKVVQKLEHPEDSGVEIDEEKGEKKKKKRISTLHAHEFYRHSPEISSRTSEAPTIIQTPKLPPNMLASRNAEGFYTSSGLVDAGVSTSRVASRTIAERSDRQEPEDEVKSSAAPTTEQAGNGNEEPTMAELMALIQQQQSTIQQMMLKMQKMEKK